MNISRFEKVHDLAPGEMTKTITDIFPKFTKHEMSLVRHPEHGVVLAPKAVKHLKAKYDPPKEAKPSCRISVKFPEEEYTEIIAEAEQSGLKPGVYLYNLISNRKE